MFDTDFLLKADGRPREPAALQVAEDHAKAKSHSRGMPPSIRADLGASPPWLHASGYRVPFWPVSALEVISVCSSGAAARSFSRPSANATTARTKGRLSISTSTPL